MCRQELDKDMSWKWLLTSARTKQKQKSSKSLMWALHFNWIIPKCLRISDVLLSFAVPQVSLKWRQDLAALCHVVPTRWQGYLSQVNSSCSFEKHFGTRGQSKTSTGNTAGWGYSALNQIILNIGNQLKPVLRTPPAKKRIWKSTPPITNSLFHDDLFF